MVVKPEWAVRGCSWPIVGDISGLHRRIEWSVDDAVSYGGLRLGFVVQHEMKPFFIEVRIPR